MEKNNLIKNEKHFISVITVVYNGEKTISDTVNSVLNQTYDNIELIIIDGGSSDSTLKMLEPFKNRINCLISEPDKGIYDAMNKGVSVANGEWIIFLNSDDVFHSVETLSQLSGSIKDNPNVEFVYGKVRLVDNGKFLFNKGSVIENKDYWRPTKFMCHQAIMCKREIFKRLGGFEVGVGGGISDYIWLVNYFRSEHGEVLFLDEIIADFSRGGYYEQHVWEAYIEQLKFAKKTFPFTTRLQIYKMFPVMFVKFKILKLHKDTLYRKIYRKFKYFLLYRKSCAKIRQV